MAMQDMVKVEEENEEGVEVDLTEVDSTNAATKVTTKVIDPVNPNIEDQLLGTESDEALESSAKTPEERFKAFSELDPEAAEDYSTKVQKRIDKLTYKFHEEERQKQAAIDFAEGVKSENLTLRTQNAQGQHGYFTVQQKQVEAELEQAKYLYKEAHASNDGELMAEANQNISKFASQLSNIESRIDQAKRNPLLQPQPAPQYQQPAPQQQQQRAEPDEKAQDWAGRNEWFGSNQDMTQGALAIHTKLINEEGYLPTSDAYYAALDDRVRKNFPSAFKAANPAANLGGSQQVVTPGDNGGGGGSHKKSKKVKLSASQVAIAKKLGVPLEEYAKYV